MIRVEIRCFNSLRRHAPRPIRLELEAGARISQAVRDIGLPVDAIYVALRNGRNVSASLGGPIEDEELADGDVLAFSGPIPFSRGYGGPVV